MLLGDFRDHINNLIDIYGDEILELPIIAEDLTITEDDRLTIDINHDSGEIIVD